MDDLLISRTIANNQIRRRRYRLASISPLSPIREVSHASESCTSPRTRKPIKDQRRSRRNFHKHQTLIRKKREEPPVLLSPLFLTAEESYQLAALSMDVEMTGGESLGGLGFNSLTKSFIPSPGHLHPRHQKHDSLSSISAASSTNSSPTTTVSTVESSSSNDDKSPASSPDSPRNIIPLGAFSKPGLSTLNTTSSSTMASSPNHPYRSLSPIKKARNTKNLSLNMSGNSSRPGTASSFQSNSSLTDNNRSSSAPSSPGFILPSTMPRRRPSNLGLTIKLPGPEKSIQKATRPSLRHHVSSPSLFTPGGQAKTLSGRPSRLFTPPNHFSPVESVSSQSFSSTQAPSSPIEAPGPIIEMDEEDIAMMENDGEGPKSPAYPEGPACIYEPNIYLFSEPNADMARNFDVVFNVAREVVNPMKKEQAEREKMKILSPAPATASSVDSFMTAFESPQASQSTTPKPTPQDKKDPEYIHMPWDHNTPIVGDLPKLVEMIKQRSNEGKKILVHCQCGVSRSASLIIAYGLYMNPRQTVQEAYDFVKQRSKWIGPNMSLIYQLSEWKAKLAAQNSVGRTGKSSVRGGANGMARPKLGHPSRSANSSDPTPYTPEIDEPMTAPLPYIPGQVAPPRPPSPDPRDFPMQMNIQTRNADGGIITGIEPGPMSAPPGMINIPGTASVTNHGISWGAGDAGTSYVPPTLPPTTTSPSEPEGDVVGDLVGFPARRGSDQGDLPPPTPSFAPKGGMIFEKRQLRNRNRKLLQSLRAEENNMPPPSPVTATNPGLLNSHVSSSPPQRSHSPQPSIKAILPKSSGLAALRAKKNKSELSRAMSDQSGVSRRAEGAARPNPEFHRRFPSILSSIDEPPPTPSFTQPPSSFGFPVRMPTITGKSHSDSQVLTRSRAAAAAGSISSSFPGPAPSSSPNEIASPIDQPMSGTDNLDGVDLFSDPRSPVNQHDALPTIRNIFDVL